jgi:hypothetical protein
MTCAALAGSGLPESIPGRAGPSPLANRDRVSPAARGLLAVTRVKSFVSCFLSRHAVSPFAFRFLRVRGGASQAAEKLSPGALWRRHLARQSFVRFRGCGWKPALHSRLGVFSTASMVSAFAGTRARTHVSSATRRLLFETPPTLGLAGFSG